MMISSVSPLPQKTCQDQRKVFSMTDCPGLSRVTKLPANAMMLASYWWASSLVGFPV